MQRFGLVIVERRFWIFLSYYLFAIAILKGLRTPVNWAATQAQFDYSQGFIKRGLFGALFHTLHIPINHYYVFTFISFIIILFFLIFILIIVNTASSDIELAINLPIFLSSMAVTYVISLVGYFDILLLLFMTLSIYFCRPDNLRGFSFDVAICTICVLLHEHFLLTAFPVIAFKYLWSMRRIGDAIPSVPIAKVTFLICIVLCLTCFIAFYPSLSKDKLNILRSSIISDVDFSPYKGVFNVLNRSFFDNIKRMASIISFPSFWIDVYDGTLSILPITFYFLFLSVRRLDHLNFSNKRLIVSGSCVCSLSALSMQVLGADVQRWYALSCINSFFVYLIIVRDTIVQPPKLQLDEPKTMNQRMAFSPLILLALFTNIWIFSVLMQQGTINNFPFTNNIPFIKNFIFGSKPIKSLVTK